MKNENMQQMVNSALKLLRKDPLHTYGFAGFGGFAADMQDDIVKLIRNLPGVSLFLPLGYNHLLIFP